MIKSKFNGILVIAFALFFAGNISAQISPGKLCSAHSKLEGISKCTNCHVLGDKVENFKCLNCHKEIKALIENKEGLHGSPEVKGKNCSVCHGEHFGRNFEIVHFNKKAFDHSKTGFKLEGKHDSVKCEDCHKPDFIKDKKLKKRSKTFLGLSRDCSACHKDYHRGKLGNDCSSCHNTTAFRPAPGFNHDKTKFKLTGAHSKTDCIKCHKKSLRNGVEFQQFTGVKFNSCANCHKDVHKGKFGKNCSACHSTASFKKIKGIKNFNHSLTNFPLKGKHRFVKCSKCHGKNLNSKPKHKLCNNCHKDYHKGSLVRNNSNPDCSKCHDVYGFKNTKFGIGEHQKTQFKLTGAHLAVPCVECHVVDGNSKNWKFKFSSLKCAECHENIHQNKMSPKFIDGGNCTDCHKPSGWASIEFDHSVTGFKLIGKHGSVKCKECHVKKVKSGEVQIFKSLTADCTQCHEDIHFGQFDVKGKTDCLKCHNFENWKPTKFDHNRTAFPLTGAHAKVDCFACHKIEKKGNKRFVKFKIEDVTCASCHS